MNNEYYVVNQNKYREYLLKRLLEEGFLPEEARPMVNTFLD